MKPTIIIFILFSTISFSQNKRFEIGYTHNFSFYNECAKYYAVDNIKENKENNVKSKSLSTYLTYSIFNNIKHNVRFGFSFRYSQLKAEKYQDYILKYNHNHSPSFNTTFEEKYLLNDPADLICNSFEYGLTSNYNFKLFTRNNFSGTLGSQLEIYLIQYNQSYFETTTNLSQMPFIYSDDISSFYQQGNNTHNDRVNFFTNKPNFFPEKPRHISSFNSSIFYKFSWVNENRPDLSIKISLGTNIYSNWKQFSKYAWLGLGLEVGLGKLKTQK